jgi:hypothetical protein
MPGEHCLPVQLNAVQIRIYITACTAQINAVKPDFIQKNQGGFHGEIKNISGREREYGYCFLHAANPE